MCFVYYYEVQLIKDDNIHWKKVRGGDTEYKICPKHQFYFNEGF